LNGRFAQDGQEGHSKRDALAARQEIGDENIRTHESLNRRMNPEMPTAGDEKVIPLADEEELERQRRRKSRGGGRASTVLTSDDEGLGG
jgi:hypothetical protein